MAVNKIGQKQWQKYFDTFSLKYRKDEQPEYIEVQVTSENLDVQTEMPWIVLKGITCDPKSDLLEIQIDKTEHLISQPKEIYVEEVGGGGETGIKIIQMNGEKNLIEIR